MFTLLVSVFTSVVLRAHGQFEPFGFFQGSMGGVPVGQVILSNVGGNRPNAYAVSFGGTDVSMYKRTGWRLPPPAIPLPPLRPPPPREIVVPANVEYTTPPTVTVRNYPVLKTTTTRNYQDSYKPPVARPIKPKPCRTRPPKRTSTKPPYYPPRTSYAETTTKAPYYLPMNAYPEAPPPALYVTPDDPYFLYTEQPPPVPPVDPYLITEEPIGLPQSFNIDDTYLPPAPRPSGFTPVDVVFPPVTQAPIRRPGRPPAPTIPPIRRLPTIPPLEPIGFPNIPELFQIPEAG